jgi:hypothetical protein
MAAVEIQTFLNTVYDKMLWEVVTVLPYTCLHFYSRLKSFIK